MTSIRARLFLILMVTTGIVWMSAIAWIYMNTRSEVERVLDARLIEAARMVNSLIASQDIKPAQAAALPADMTGQHPSHPSYKRQLSCQIWALDGTLVGRSESAPGQPLTDDKTGFSETVVDGETWRVYALENHELGVRVMVGDNLSIRDRLVRDVIRGLILPGLLTLPALAGLIWLSVRKGLRPLNDMAHTLEQRQASDLSPLPDGDSPDEIRPMILSLNGLFARVSTAREHERDFTAFAAHELRTPIAGLKAQAQIALGAKNDDMRSHALRQIVIGVDRTSRLVRQLTDLTSAESGTMEQNGPGFNVGMSIRKLAENIHHHHPDSARLVIDAALDKVHLQVNEALFMLATRNLLENAVQHSPAGSEVTCGLERDAQGIRITIDDCGPGIASDELSKVRQRFFRGRNKTAMGSGLGLAIADMALERINGKLHLSNRDEAGLRAEVMFHHRNIK